jgi:ABC-type lipoprotein export system ATPase subunit
VSDGWAIELRDVFRVHRTPQGDAAALQGATLRVARGEQLAVLGPSGSGKSTLLRCVAGLEPPSAGAVCVLGHDIGRLPARARARLRRDSIGVLSQGSGHTLSPDLTLGRAVALPLALRGVAAADSRERATALLTAVGLGDRAGALPGELSGGERQRVALCAALVHRPAILLADEPTGELDDDSAGVVYELIAELGRSEGATVVLVSHDPGARSAMDRAVALRDGRVGEELSGADVSLVVGRGGWVRLPPELLSGAGIGERAVARAGEGAVVLEPAGRAGVTPAASEPGAARAAEPRPDATASGPGSAVEVRSLTKAYGSGAGLRRVLFELSHRFEAGRLTAITGRSGSGKTTLLRLVCGLEVPDAGEVIVEGRSLSALGAEQRADLRRELIGFMGQEPGLMPHLAADENIELALAVMDVAGRPARELAATWLARLGLGDRAGQRVSRLSGGERQRVALARALACSRGLVVLDEPTSHLDEATTTMVAEILVRVASEQRLTVICATHEPLVASRAHHEVAL